ANPRCPSDVHKSYEYPGTGPVLYWYGGQAVLPADAVRWALFQHDSPGGVHNDARCGEVAIYCADRIDSPYVGGLCGLVPSPVRGFGRRERYRYYGQCSWGLEPTRRYDYLLRISQRF